MKRPRLSVTPTAPEFVMGWEIRHSGSPIPKILVYRGLHLSGIWNSSSGIDTFTTLGLATHLIEQVAEIRGDLSDGDVSGGRSGPGLRVGLVPQQPLQLPVELERRAQQRPARSFRPRPLEDDILRGPGVPLPDRPRRRGELPPRLPAGSRLAGMGRARSGRDAIGSASATRSRRFDSATALTAQIKSTAIVTAAPRAATRLRWCPS
jgi:hypothetical protein